VLDIFDALFFEKGLGAGAIAAKLPCVDGDGYHNLSRLMPGIPVI
jgi:hypothetical protein